MPLQYTAQQLILDIRNLAALNNTGSEGATDTDILLHINASVKETLLPFVHNAREDYLVVRERQAPNDAGEVRMPARAAWNKISNAFWVDGNGMRRYLQYMRPDFLHTHFATGASVPEGFILEGNTITLLPVTSEGEVELSYFFRPGDIVKTTAARQVTAVDLDTGIVTVTADVPTTWTAAVKYDVHSGNSGAEIKAWSVTPLTVADDTITFTATDIDGSTFGRHAMEVGDWIALEGEAALPALPVEWHPFIVRAVAARYAEAEGDVQALQSHTAWLDKAMSLGAKVAENRVELKPRRMSLRKGTLWAGKRGGWGWHR